VLYRDQGGLIALDWHMQPTGLPGYRERAYRMDETQNNPYISLLKEIRPALRIANGFETKDRWWMEYERKRLAPMVERLTMISNDGSGLILRPFHEADGDWFWWGLKWLKGDGKLQGKDALRVLFAETARYMKQRLPGILIAFSTDKLGNVDDAASSNKQFAAQRFADEYATFLPTNPADLALIDIYGVDLYTDNDNPAPSRKKFRNKLAGLSLLAKQHGKIAAITETGNRGLPAEEDGRQPCIDWFDTYLQSWIADPDVHIAYALIWQNWSNNRNPTEDDPGDGYFVPVNPESAAGKDFRKYIERSETLMLGDLKNSW
jgi:mannan endo-1,4-beta-mannosidase